MDRHEPRFVHLSPTSLVEAASKAKATLPRFREALGRPRRDGAFYGVKVHFARAGGTEGWHIWLAVNDLFADLYFCAPIELPADFVGLAMGESKLVTDEEVEDWIILDGGTLHGGFSLRAFREQLPAAERAGYDSYMGVTDYAGEGVA